MTSQSGEVTRTHVRQLVKPLLGIGVFVQFLVGLTFLVPFHVRATPAFVLAVVQWSGVGYVSSALACTIYESFGNSGLTSVELTSMDLITLPIVGGLMVWNFIPMVAVPLRRTMFICFDISLSR